MPDTPGTTPPDAEIVTVRPALAAAFAKMAARIPEESEDGADRIIAAILDAPSWEHLSDPWEATNGAALAGRRLEITGALRRPSEYTGGLGVFLVVFATDTATGEQVAFTTSATSIVAQLARAYALDALPLHAEVVVPKRPSAAGFYPQHLRITGGTRRPPAQTTEVPF